MLTVPRLYPIVDAGVLSRHGLTVADFARELRAAGVMLLQYRDKAGVTQEVLRAARVIREVFAETQCRLILNDRADLAVLAGWHGVHVGQGDLSPEDARRVVGAGRWIGTSTHTEGQVRLADAGCADYVAVGPVFATRTKLDAEPAVGLEGVRRARGLTSKPIVAIGGITRENAWSVINAGANSVAVISALLAEGESVSKVARDFIKILG
ncbi:MAG: thiamine phosphate synthase [Edaphobacter sp.]